MPKVKKDAEIELVEGMDTGDPSPSTKIHVALNSGGKCCFPDCENHLTLTNTKVTECAHIIPRKVGFVREDWKTPPESRKKADNLIYICSIHHKVIDNPDNEDKYSSSTLHAWKKDHEEWARKTKKNVASLPDSFRNRFQETMASLDKELANESKISEQLLARLLTDCKTLIRKRYLDKAEVLITQAETLLSDFNDTSLNVELKALKANLLWRQGKIPEAKVLYLELLGASDHVEVMLDYIDFCHFVPEDGDLAAKYEEKVKQIAPDHARLKLLELNRKYQRREKLEAEINEEKWTDDDWLNGQFYLTYALFLDLAGDKEKRDYFIAQWEKLFTESPRPNLFRVLFMSLDTYRNEINSGEEALALLKKIQTQEEIIFSEGKDPLSSHDRISLLVEKVKIYNTILQFSFSDLEGLVETRDELLALINESYFDKHINLLLPELLSTVLIDLLQWKGLIASILASKVVPSTDLIDLIFLQGLNLSSDPAEIRQVTAAYSRNDLSDLLDAVEQENVNGIVAATEGKEDKFKLILFQSICDANLRAEVVQNVELLEDTQIDPLYFQLEAFEATGNTKEAVKRAKQANLEKVPLAFLRLINHVASKYGEHRLAIESGEKILGFDLPSEYRTELHGKLATAFSHSDDDRNAYEHALEALKNSNYLGKLNTQTLIVIAVNSLLALDKNDEAAEFIEDHAGKIQETPELGIFFADTVLKAAHENKAEKAIEYITQAFTHAPSSGEKLYLPAFLVLNELTNLGFISTESKSTVGDGQFIKLAGLGDTWFYTGEEAGAFGATAINEGNPRYQAVIDKSLSEEIDWPADKYSSSKNTKKIALILDRNGYFYAKSSEIMQAMAERGHEAIWTIEVLNEDGTLNKENLMKFHQEEFRNQLEFFQSYCENPLPFAMLCSVEGSIQQALSRICDENKGFVRCNNSTTQQLQEQHQVAEKIADGQPFFIDSLTALMLCESGLLQAIIDQLPNIHVTTTVIKSLRDIAEALRTGSSKGRMGFTGGTPRITERNAKSEEQFRQKILSAADMLDNLPNRVIGDTYKKDEDSEIDLDTVLPSWIVDTVRLAQEKECVVVTDDALTLEAYKIKEGRAPLGTSSLILIRCLYESGFFTWEQYLQYFRLLSSYRYYLLPISVEEMEKAVLEESGSGLVLFTPKNIEYLNLSLTFSNEYGVEDKLAVRIAALFFNRIIVRDDITESMADEIFPRVIIGVLSGRDAKLWGNVIINLCKKQLDDNSFPSSLAYKKFALLEQQIMRYAEEFNPIIQSVPSLLRIGYSTKKEE